MKFYKNHHRYYCGIDLHAKQMYLCVVDSSGTKHLHKNIATKPDEFLEAIAPFREDLIVGVEGMFCWYWIADLCESEGIPFTLGHALYMRAVHGAKTKSDKLDSERIALLLKSGMFPEAYVYPKEMRACRDLLRRRLFTVRKRGELLAHLNMTHYQYNAEVPTKSLGYKKNRENISDPFIDPALRRMIESDSRLVDTYTKEVKDIELFIRREAMKTGKNALHLTLLKTVPGIGDVLSLTLLYEINTIERFPAVQNFCSYARLVKPTRSSAGKRTGGGGGKMGNHHLRWAFAEASVMLIRNSPEAKQYFARLQKQYHKAKALSTLSHRLGIAVYFMLKRETAFDQRMFFRI